MKSFSVIIFLVYLNVTFATFPNGFSPFFSSIISPSTPEPSKETSTTGTSKSTDPDAGSSLIDLLLDVANETDINTLMEPEPVESVTSIDIDVTEASNIESITVGPNEAIPPRVVCIKSSSVVLFRYVQHKLRRFILKTLEFLALPLEALRDVVNLFLVAITDGFFTLFGYYEPACRQRFICKAASSIVYFVPNWLRKTFERNWQPVARLASQLNLLDSENELVDALVNGALESNCTQLINNGTLFSGIILLVSFNSWTGRETNMNSLIKGITSAANKKKEKPVTIDNCIFRLHYRVTTIYLLACAMLVSSKQLFGDPIKCNMSSKKKVPEELLDTFCWAHTTFSVNSAWTSVVGEQVIYPGVSNSQDRSNLVHHVYYQWVAIVLFIQAFFFYLPHFLWKSLYRRKISDSLPDGESKDIKFVANSLARHIGRSNKIRFCYIMVVFLNLLNVLLQIYSTDRFLGGNFIYYGLSILHHSDWGFSSHYDPMLRIFPRMTKCTFYSYGDSGDVSKDDALCILPVNVVNEKIYLLLWFWMTFLLLLTCIDLLYQMASLTFRCLSTRYLRFHCSRESTQMLDDLNRVFSSGDLFMLTLIRKNMDKVDFDDLLRELHLKMRHKQLRALYEMANNWPAIKSQEVKRETHQNIYTTQTEV